MITVYIYTVNPSVLYPYSFLPGNILKYLPNNLYGTWQVIEKLDEKELILLMPPGNNPLVEEIYKVESWLKFTYKRVL